MEGGRVDLDLGFRASSSRVLRIQVKQNGKIVSSSATRKGWRIGDGSIENSIMQARNDLFDEELYYELYREARSLTNRGVRCVRDTITFPLAAEKEVTVELVPINAFMAEAKELSATDVGIAELLVNAARVLLSHAHRQTLNHRSQLQPPLTEKKPPRPLYSILRPILAHLQHLSASKETLGFLKGLESMLKRANIPLIINDSSSTTELLQITGPTPQPHQTFVDAFVNSISAPLHSAIFLEMPLTSSSLTIHTRTYLMGTEYNIVIAGSAPSSSLSLVPRETHFTSAKEMENHLTHLLTLDTISFIEASPNNGGWIVTSPHTGQLAIDRGVNSSPQSMTLYITPNEISLHWNGMIDKQESEGVYIWSMADTHDEQPKELLEVSRRIAFGLTI